MTSDNGKKVLTAWQTLAAVAAVALPCGGMIAVTAASNAATRTQLEEHVRHQETADVGPKVEDVRSRVDRLEVRYEYIAESLCEIKAAVAAVRDEMRVKNKEDGR